MCEHWDDITVGMKVEVLNTNAVLPSKVYWIATVIQIAGASVLLYEHDYHDNDTNVIFCHYPELLFVFSLHPV